jgi:transposase-like protein
LGRALRVTPRIAWFILLRVRAALATCTFVKLSGTVEVDETYVGGQAKFMHSDARARKIHGTGGTDKAIDQGAKCRDSGRVHATFVEGTDAATLQGNIREWVEPGSAVFTDQQRAYIGLDSDYAHKTIDHSREYVSGIVHTNGIENFWSLFKRAFKGAQTHADRAHLHRYVTEHTFSYNNRESTNLEGLCRAFAGTAGRRLAWAQLTDHV